MQIGAAWPQCRALYGVDVMMQWRDDGAAGRTVIPSPASLYCISPGHCACVLHCTSSDDFHTTRILLFQGALTTVLIAHRLSRCWSSATIRLTLARFSNSAQTFIIMSLTPSMVRIPTNLHNFGQSSKPMHKYRRSSTLIPETTQSAAPWRCSRLADKQTLNRQNLSRRILIFIQCWIHSMFNIHPLYICECENV